jgi:hypothetical protein
MVIWFIMGNVLLYLNHQYLRQSNGTKKRLYIVNFIRLHLKKRFSVILINYFGQIVILKYSTKSLDRLKVKNLKVHKCVILLHSKTPFCKVHDTYPVYTWYNVHSNCILLILPLMVNIKNVVLFMHFYIWLYNTLMHF